MYELLFMYSHLGIHSSVFNRLFANFQVNLHAKKDNVRFTMVPLKAFFDESINYLSLFII